MPVPFVAAPSWLASAPSAPEAASYAGAHGAHGALDAPGALRAPGVLDGPGALGAELPAAGAPPAGRSGSGVPVADAGTRPHPIGTADAPRARHPAATPVDPAALGELAPYADDPRVTDLFVNGASGLWIDRGAGPEPEPAWEADEAAVRRLAVRLIAAGGRHIDEATPAVDVRLGGMRVHGVLPPVSRSGTLLSVRIPRAAGRSLDELAHGGMLDAAQLARLRAAIANRENVLVTGAGGTGKTTLLAAMLAEAPPGERIVVVEDVAELDVRHPHLVGLESRQANLEGTGRIGLDVLVREALRMRPDRLVVGECRGPELRELLGALNTGHDGGAGTLHANSLADVPARLEALGAAAGLDASALARQAASAIDLVVHLERRGVRRVHEIGGLAVHADRLATVPE